jgi:hypothetical protein
MARMAAIWGISVHGDPARTREAVSAILQRHALSDAVEGVDDEGACRFVLLPETASRWLPDHDTTGLAKLLNLDTHQRPDDLEKEILVALLASPVLIEFPSVEELTAHIHIRRNIVTSARKTELNFDTAAAERPDDCWCYDDERGFTVKPGCPLIHALKKATQPELSGHLYSFSCYRATEYVILLAIAKELAVCNPGLLDRLQVQCERRVIRSGQFHDVFLHEYGSQESPYPTHYYVPGDRVWFRNPDASSSDVVGFEGSWVLYLGEGLFTNFWKHNRPYTLADKCLEIYHWRNGTVRDSAGELAMDEAIVEKRVAESLNDPGDIARIMECMMRCRDPKDVYEKGGCIDTTREGPRWVCPGTADLVLPR